MIMTCVFAIFLILHSDDDQILVQTESIGDGMIDAVEEIIDENPRPSPSAIIVLVSLFLASKHLLFLRPNEY